VFTTDSRTEKFLDSIGVKWHYSNAIAFGELSPIWDTTNLGRSQVQVAGAIDAYGALMDRGSAAPAPILWKSPKRIFEVLDGIQRLLAERARKPVSFSAYIAESDSQAMVAKIRVFANYRLQGGYQESAEWTLERAIELLVNGGVMSLEEVADIGGWSASAVRDKKQVIDFRQAVCGVGGPERMTDSILRIVAQHATRDDFASAPVALGHFFNDIARMRLSAAEAEPYIEQFFNVARAKARLFSQFETKLSEFRGDEDVAARLADPTRRCYQPMTPDGRLLKALRAALTTAERVLATSDGVVGTDECFQVIGKLRKTVQQIDKMSRRSK
jgi:hypothetical protein